MSAADDELLRKRDAALLLLISKGLKQKERPPWLLLARIPPKWFKNFKITRSRHRYRCALHPPPAGLVTVMHWDIQPHFSSTSSNVLVAETLESFCCLCCIHTAIQCPFGSASRSHYSISHYWSGSNCEVRCLQGYCDAINSEKKKKKKCWGWAGLFWFYGKVQRWLTTCRIHPVVHANESLEYSSEMNCVSKGSFYFLLWTIR